MADTVTAKLGAIKPEVGASNNTWGTKQNAAFDIFDAAISGTPATVASATTTDLSATTVPTLNISGSVTINSFGSAVSGMIRRLFFSGSPLITHSANIDLLGDTNRQISPGDTMEVISDGGGVWREFNRGSNLTTTPVPVGSVMDYAGVAAPSGWLLCFGQAVSRTTYSALFAVLSTTYGVGDGSTTFNLPDARGRVVAGQDDMGGTSANRLTTPLNGDTLGAVGGAESVALSIAELATHNHTFSDTATTGNASANHQHGGGATSSVAGSSQTSMQGGAPNGGSDGTDQPSGSLHTHSVTVSGTTSNAGAGTAHNNVQPTLILNKIVFASV